MSYLNKELIYTYLKDNRVDKSGKYKVLIIGLDSACFERMYSLLENNELPNISNLIQNGVSGILNCNELPGTVPGWTSVVTGVNEGKHGLYLFNKPYATELTICTPEDRGCPALWDLLSDVRFVVINHPMTYPPEKINGIMVSGMLAPHDSIFTHPEDFTEILKKAGYEIEKSWTTKDVYIEVTEKRAELAKLIMENYAWDIFMVIFTNLDRIQHRFGNDISFVDSHYKQLDRIIGELISLTDENTTIIITSDHGMKPYSKSFQTNSWLAEKGLYAVKKSSIIERIRNKAFEWISGRKNEYNGNVIKEILKPNTVTDYTKTKAYSLVSRGININLRGREEKGIVKPGKEYEELREFIIEELLKITDPKTGKKVVKKAVKREEVFNGHRVSDLPDIIFDMEEEFYIGYEKQISKHVIRELNPPFHSHTRDGILILYGKNIKKGVKIEADIVDITPTILYLMGKPVYSYMDGKVLTKAIEPEYLQQNPVKIEEKELLDKYSDLEIEMDEKVMENLRALGYLS